MSYDVSPNPTPYARNSPYFTYLETQLLFSWWQIPIHPCFWSANDCPALCFAPLTLSHPTVQVTLFTYDISNPGRLRPGQSEWSCPQCDLRLLWCWTNSANKPWRKCLQRAISEKVKRLELKFEEKEFKTQASAWPKNLPVDQLEVDMFLPEIHSRSWWVGK
jgi:hypothetical protein